MTYKYQNEISQFRPCPPTRYRESEVPKAFRWIHDTGDENSFTPPYQKNPKRIVTGKDKKNCEGFALSFFDSHNSAKQRYRALLKRLGKRFLVDVGDKIAVGEIRHNDGKCSPINANGHFELHQYAEAILVDRFSIVEELSIVERKDSDGNNDFDLK